MYSFFIVLKVSVMRICAKHYTGTNGVYAHVTPDYHTTHVLTGIVWYTHPPFPVHSVPYTSHVTVACSDTAIDTVRMPYPKRAVISKISHAEYWQVEGMGIAVFILDSPIFKHLNSLFVQRGAIHRHPKYIPHITVAMNTDASDKDMRNWVQRSTNYVRHEPHSLTFNRLNVRDMYF